MKTREQILEGIKNGRKSNCIDGRDFSRLAMFFPIKDFDILGCELIEGAKHTPKDLTYDNVISQLKEDVAFGFKKALGQRGISSELMYEVVKMWSWVLEDELIDFDSYTMYGLPLFKAVALKYGFNNPIGTDEGNEEKYEESY